MPPSVFIRLTALACLAGVSHAVPTLAAAHQDVPPAQALLERAEKRARDGRYRDAVHYYKQLAGKYPATEQGRIGARRSKPSAYLGWAPIGENGPSQNRVDVVFMGDGYQIDELDQLDDLAADAVPLFERQRTFREYFSYLNFQRLALVSADNGVDGFGREYDTALGGRTLGTFAGHVGVDGSLVRAMLEQKGEHDGLAIVFVKLGVLGTGGDGLACIGGRSPRTTVHEWGHAFAGLGDEYATETHERGGVGTSVNVSATDDPERVPWKHWLDAKVPGIGIYEGASGQVRGAWKPTSGGCVMEDGEFFCPPCREALVLRIYSLVDPIESCSPLPHPLDHAVHLKLADEFAPLEFEVRVMKPARHELEVRWWVLSEHETPPGPRGTTERYRNRYEDRRQRGRLPLIAPAPLRESLHERTGVNRFVLAKKDLAPGRYRVVCRVRDTTRLRGERFPWVLKDEHELLVSERAWWVVVSD